MNTSPSFPTLGAAVLYLNSFHHGKYLGRLNYLAAMTPSWVMSLAESMWESRNEDIAKDYPDLLAFSINETYVKQYNEVH